jgi:hypothetical protein
VLNLFYFQKFVNYKGIYKIKKQKNKNRFFIGTNPAAVLLRQHTVAKRVRLKPIENVTNTINNVKWGK